VLRRFSVFIIVIVVVGVGLSAVFELEKDSGVLEKETDIVMDGDQVKVDGSSQSGGCDRV
jgi:hypothetical protein